MADQDTTTGPQISDLERERLKLQAQIADLKVKLESADAVDRIRYSNSLEKLESDYRQLIIAMKPPAGRDPGTAPTTKEFPVPQADGSTKNYLYKWDGAKWVLDESAPVTVTPPTAASRPPTDPSKWLPVRADPNDPNSRIIALQDPLNSSNRVAVTADASAQRPTVVDGERGQKFSWDGTTLKELIPASAEKRQIVQGAGGAIYSWDGQKLEAVQPGTYQAKNGDTMQDVVNGQYVTKTFQNGQWGITNVGKSAVPGAPQEGDTMTDVINGRTVTKTFQHGQWGVTDVGKTVVPEKPTQLQAPTDQPNIVTINDQGQIGQQTSPNFIPKTNAEIQARIGQIQQAMLQKKAEVTGKVKPDGSFTEQQALDEYNKWYDQNVAPQQATLQAAQQDAALARAKDQAKMRGDAYQQALAAGTLNVSAFNALREANPIGNPEAYSSVMNQIGSKMGLKDLGSAFTYQAENPMETAQKSVTDALKYIDPNAATAAGLPPPNFQGIDIGAAIARDRYAAPGVPAPAGPPATLPATGGPPPATLPGAPPPPKPPGVDFAALAQRQAASTAEQLAQRNIVMPGAPAPDPNAWFTEWQKRQAADVALQRQQAAIGPSPWDIAPAYSVGG